MSAAGKVSLARSFALKAALLALAAAALVAHLLSLPGLRTAVVLEPLYEGNLSGAALAPSSLTAVDSDAGRQCDFDALVRANTEVLHPLLTQLVQTPFFRYFRVNLYKHCPFWPEDGICALPDCSVCECPADEVPVPWRALKPGLDVEAPQGGPLTPQTAECVGDQSAEGLQEAQLNAVEGLVNTGDGPGAPSKDTQAAWVQRDNPWTADDEAVGETDSQAVYVNLRLNPERYTGYTGEHAHRVWTAIYAQPCFAGQGGGLCAARQAAPLEEVGVFYRLISGMHASISTHIAADFLLQRGGGGSDDVWGPNYGVFWDRVGSHPDRLENLRFITAFVLQAVNKAKPLLLAADYSTGFPDQDRATHDHLRQLLTRPALLSGCALAPFNELRLFAGPDGPRLKEEMRGYFRNISAVMDCVGCEKCRLWGKLQTLGLATALKIVFPDDSRAVPNLTRNEVIALLNLLGRLSESLHFSSAALGAIKAGRVAIDEPRWTTQTQLSWLKL